MTPELRNELNSQGRSLSHINQRFYYVNPKQGATKPYVVFSDVTNSESRDTAKRYPENFVQFEFVSKTMSQLEEILAEYRAILDTKGSLTVEGYNVVQATHQFTATPIFLDDIKAWVQVVQYLIELEPL